MVITCALAAALCLVFAIRQIAWVTPLVFGTRAEGRIVSFRGDGDESVRTAQFRFTTRDGVVHDVWSQSPLASDSYDQGDAVTVTIPGDGPDDAEILDIHLFVITLVLLGCTIAFTAFAGGGILYLRSSPHPLRRP